MNINYNCSIINIEETTAKTYPIETIKQTLVGTKQLIEKGKKE